MPTVFHPERAKGMDAVVQFIVTGEEEFQGYLEIHEGIAEDPTVAVITPADVWLKVSRGEMSGTWAFMTRKYKEKGNWRILSKFNKLFR